MPEKKKKMQKTQRSLRVGRRKTRGRVEKKTNAEMKDKKNREKKPHGLG
jgi:hypothetical protein